MLCWVWYPAIRALSTWTQKRHSTTQSTSKPGKGRVCVQQAKLQTSVLRIVFAFCFLSRRGWEKRIVWVVSVTWGCQNPLKWASSIFIFKGKVFNFHFPKNPLLQCLGRAQSMTIPSIVASPRCPIASWIARWTPIGKTGGRWGSMWGEDLVLQLESWLIIRVWNGQLWQDVIHFRHYLDDFWATSQWLVDWFFHIPRFECLSIAALMKTDSSSAFLSKIFWRQIWLVWLVFGRGRLWMYAFMWMIWYFKIPDAVWSLQELSAIC